MPQTGQATEKIPNKRPRIDALLKTLSLPDDQKKMLHGVLTDLNEECRHIYRIIPSPQEAVVSAGGGAGGGGSVNPEIVLGTLIYQNDKSLSCPSERITYDIWGRPNEKHILATKLNCQITEIRGILDLESNNGGSPLRFKVECPFFSGNPRIPANTLISFNIGFLRFDHPKNFFVDTQVYVSETTNPVSQAQIVNQVPVTGLGARYLTQIPILNDPLLADYNTGGAGIKFHCILYIYGRNI